MTESRSTPDDLDRRIDDLLHQRFALPAELDSLAARARPVPRRRPRPWLVALAAAAVLATLFLWREELREAPGPKPRGRPARSLVARAEPLSLGADVSFCRLIGPLVDGEPQPGSVHSPDLARLYRDMDACQRGSTDAACGTGDFLGERISESYGQQIELRPEAAGVLHGPFGSDEWPTATIVTGTSDEMTTVLVADRVTTLDCCVQPHLPENSGLRIFTWRVGDVVLNEITPFEEPRLLPYFE